MTDRSPFQDTLLHIEMADATIEGSLTLPDEARGLVLFAHGSGSNRHSLRNRTVAHALEDAGIGTLLLDLLTPTEQRMDQATAHLRFDIGLLAGRLIGATRWLIQWQETGALRMGYFGASTGGGVALLAAAYLPHMISAVVSRGGRVDLAGDALARVQSPTLLLVGERDQPVLQANQEALAQFTTTARLEVIPRASHLFQEPGALDQVQVLAGAWFSRYLSQ